MNHRTGELLSRTVFEPQSMSLPSRRPPGLLLLAAWGGLLLLSASARGLDLGDQGHRLRLFAEINGMGVMTTEQKKTRANILGQAEGGAQFSGPLAAWLDVSLAVSTRFEIFEGDLSMLYRGEAGLKADPDAPLRLELDLFASYTDDSEPENSYRRAGAVLEGFWEPEGFPLSPGAGYELNYRSYYGPGGNPQEREHRIFAAVSLSLLDPFPIYAEVRYSLAWVGGNTESGAYRGHGPDLVVSLELAHNLSVFLLLGYERREYQEEGGWEVMSFAAGAELALSDALSLVTGVDFIKYAGPARGAYESIGRLFLGLRLEV